MSTQAPTKAGSGNELIQFPCRSCGAKLTYAPGDAALTCDYCGYSEPVPTSAEAVVERDFEDYKPDQVGWGADLKRWRCEQCGAETEVEPHITSMSCAFCGSDKVQPQAESKRVHRPESLLPFSIDQQQCLQAFREWVRRLWFRPNALKKQARPDRLRGVYLPFWTYDALTTSFWTAQAGYHYYVEDNEGRRQRRTRWEHVSGRHQAHFDDVLVPGSTSVDAGLLRKIEPFPTEKLVPYEPNYLAGMVAEDYRSDMLECWPAARGRMDAAIRSDVVRRIPGDTHRALSITSDYLNRTYKLCLLPVWLASYRYQGKPYTYIVNGQTGEVAGRAPWSWIKLTLFTLFVAAVIGAIVWWQSQAT